MISKELLSDVLGRDVDKVKGIEANTLIYGCVHSDGWYDEINIYELAHKCKEWAWQQHELMLLQTQYFPKIFYGIKDLKTSMEDFITKVPQCDRFSADTEPEAIFKATSYIMEQLKQKD